MYGSEAKSRLAIIREERMWTQRRLAEEAGISPRTVSGIESGRISRPHFGTVGKLARALGIDPTGVSITPDAIRQDDLLGDGGDNGE